MAWLSRRKGQARRFPEGWEQRLAEAGLTLVGVESKGTGTYVTLSGPDPEKAKAFLRNEPIEDELYYVVVQTPDGNWGVDINGIYLEGLRPWQLDVDGADHEGVIVTLIDGVHGLTTAAQGILDNYIVEVRCGGCAHEWVDGVRYANVTLVCCPSCEATNRVDSSGYTASFHLGPG
jgi:hypothetical protein